MLFFHMDTNYVAGSAWHSMCFRTLGFLIILECRIKNLIQYIHFRNEETEAQTVYVTWIRSSSKQTAEGRPEIER